jgi:ATP-binding cassette subfamily F protein 3
MSTLVLEQVSLSFGPKRIVEDLSLRIADGDRIGLIGPNGSGKTSLLRIMAREQAPDGGEVRTANGVRIGWLPQDLDVHGGRSILAFVRDAVPGRRQLEADLVEAEADYQRALDAGDDEEALMDGAARLADLHERLAHFETTFSEFEAMKILAGLGFDTTDLGRDVGELSGGWKMRVRPRLGSCFHAARRPAPRRADEPPRHREHPWPGSRAS